MRLLLLNLNYLRYQFFIKTMQKKIMDFEHPMQEGNKFPKFPIFDASFRFFWEKVGLLSQGKCAPHRASS